MPTTKANQIVIETAFGNVRIEIPPRTGLDDRRYEIWADYAGGFLFSIDRDGLMSRPGGEPANEKRAMTLSLIELLIGHPQVPQELEAALRRHRYEMYHNVVGKEVLWSRQTTACTELAADMIAFAMRGGSVVRMVNGGVEISFIYREALRITRAYMMRELDGHLGVYAEQTIVHLTDGHPQIDLLRFFPTATLGDDPEGLARTIVASASLLYPMIGQTGFVVYDNWLDQVQK
ncbi:hypothetical protein HGA91_00220 [candidate division WWE3 bacterium]|nr:hypothetical protein [candidate division WWE3 bacterium]